MTNSNNTPDAKVTQSKENQYFSRRPLLQTIASVGAFGLASGVASAEHPTEECDVTIDFNRAHVARVFDVQSADLTSLTVFYFDRDRNAQKREGIAPTKNEKYGPLRVRYDSAADKTILQIGGSDAALRRVVAYGPDCRSAKTNPLDSAAGENDVPTADFTWGPDPPVAGEDVMFTSTASDPDGELIHYGWGFDADGTEEATGEEVIHAFESAGEYDVTHTIIDDFDATDSITKPVTVAEAEHWGQVAKLSPAGGGFRDRFGWSAAVDGDTAVVGAFQDVEGDYREPAYVFTRSEGSWSQQQKLIADDVESGEIFGISVAVDGDTAVVGAHIDRNLYGVAAGAAYVFTRSDGSWSQQQKLTDVDSDRYDNFGFSVAVEDDTAVVGAYLDDNQNGDRSGAAHVFTRSGGSWSQQQKLIPNDGDSHDHFGYSVAVDGNTAVVGARYDEDPNGSDAGSAYVFTRSEGSWSQQQKLIAADGDASDNFGWSVAMDRDTTVIGAIGAEDPNGDDVGSAYIFREQSSSV